MLPLTEEELQKMVDEITADIKNLYDSKPAGVVIPSAPESITIDFIISPKKSKTIPTLEDL